MLYHPHVQLSAPYYITSTLTTYQPTYLPTYFSTPHDSIHTHSYTHTLIYTHIHSYIHTLIHTYTLTYTHTHTHIPTGNGVAKLLAQCLGDMPFIEKLNINNNNLTDEGVAAVLVACMPIKTLKHLNISRNKMDDDAAGECVYTFMCMYVYASMYL